MISFNDISTMHRFKIQVLAFQKFLKVPFIGYGWGTTPYVLKDLVRWGHQVTYNMYIQILLEIGLVGFTVFAAFLYAIWRNFKKAEQYIMTYNIDRNSNIARMLFGLKLAFIAIVYNWLNLPAYNFSYTWFILVIITIIPASLLLDIKRGNLR